MVFYKEYTEEDHINFINMVYSDCVECPNMIGWLTVTNVGEAIKKLDYGAFREDLVNREKKEWQCEFCNEWHDCELSALKCEQEHQEDDEE